LKILFLNRFYLPDVAATGQLLGELAEDLAAAGEEVCVLAGRSGYRDGSGAAGQASPEGIDRSGVRVRRIVSPGFNRHRLAGRLMSYAGYYAGCATRALTEKADVVVAMTDPPLLSALGAMRKTIRGGKLVLWMQDVFPELAYEFGVIRSPLLVRSLRRAAGGGYASADAVVALGNAMEHRLVEAGVPREKVSIIPNWADGRTLYPAPALADATRERRGWSGRFIVLYSGNMGRAHDFSAVKAAMRELAGDSNVLFLFAGEGMRRRELEEFVGREDLPNAAFEDYAEKSDLNRALNLASAFLVTQDPRSLGLIVPSKVYSSLAVGKPILAVGPRSSEVERILSDSGAGFFHEPDDAKGLAGSIRALAASPRLSSEMGERGRRHFLARCDRKIQTAKFRDLLAGITSPSSGDMRRRSSPSPGRSDG